MAVLPIFRRMLREDMPKADDWVEAIIGPFNQFAETVYQALNRKLTFSENMNAQHKEFTITAGASASDNTFRFLCTMTVKVWGVLICQILESGATYTPLSNPSSVDWHQEANEIVIDAIHGLTSGKTYNIKVLVI